MAGDDQRLIEHPINGIGGQLRAGLDGFDDAARQALEAQSPGWIARIGAAADWADGLSGLLDPRLVSFQCLDVVHQNLTQVLNHIPAAPTEASHATQAEQLVGQAVREAGGLALSAPPLPELADAIGKKIGRAVSLRTTALNRELDDLEAHLQAVRQELEQAREAASAADQQRVAEQTQRLDALSQAIDTERTRVDNFVTTAVNENQQAERERQKTHEAALKEQKGEFEVLRSELSTQGSQAAAKFNEVGKEQLAAAAAAHSELVDELKGVADSVLADLNNVKSEVDGLYEVIVKKGLSGAFADEAKTQAEAANAWRWIAIVFGVMAIGVALFTALHAPDELTWESLIAKLTVSVLLGAMATYAGKQSGSHRLRESGAKELELDLAALGPFIEQLSEGQRANVIAAFMERWMTARAIAGPDASGSPALANQIIEGLAARLISNGGPPK